MVFFLARRPRVAAAARDAETLIHRYGAEAFGVAGEMAWRQDAGLLTAPHEDHWHQVHLEVARRLGRYLPSWEGETSRVAGMTCASVGAQAQPSARASAEALPPRRSTRTRNVAAVP